LQIPIIAIIDDHQDTRNILEIVLKDQYLVRSYSNAHDAFTEMKKEKPDLVITDMLLQEGVGTELIRWMRADPILKWRWICKIFGLRSRKNGRDCSDRRSPGFPRILAISA